MGGPYGVSVISPARRVYVTQPHGFSTFIIGVDVPGTICPATGFGISEVIVSFYYLHIIFQFKGNSTSYTKDAWTHLYDR